MQKSKFLNIVLATAVLVLAILLATKNDPSAMRKKSTTTPSEGAQPAAYDSAYVPFKKNRWV
jgi:hypothetical protein